MLFSNSFSKLFPNLFTLPLVCSLINVLATQWEIQIKSFKIFPAERIVQTIIRKWEKKYETCDALEGA